MVVGRAVEGDIAAVVFRGRECHARTAKQTLEVDARRDAGSSHARFETQLDVADRERIANHCEQPRAAVSTSSSATAGRSSPNSSSPRRAMGCSGNGVTDPLGDGDEQLVAHIGTDRLVDLVKAIEVEQEQHPERCSLPSLRPISRPKPARFNRPVRWSWLAIQSSSCTWRRRRAAARPSTGTSKAHSNTSRPSSTAATSSDDLRAAEAIGA